MQSVRIQLTVDSEMSLEFARLDMSKPCDTHAIGVKVRNTQGSPVSIGRAESCQRGEAGRGRCCRKPGPEPIWAVQPGNLCKVPRDYFAARETDLDCLGIAAGFWLSMGTSYD